MKIQESYLANIVMIITNGSSLVKATKFLARFGSGLALAKPLASFGGELTFPKLLANVGGASALD